MPAVSTTAPPTDHATRRELPSWRQRLRTYLELVRFSHTVFALPLATLAALVAWQHAPFQWLHLLGFLVCMVAARTAAMAFNRLVDAPLDAANERTAARHLPAGLVSRREVLQLTIASGAAFLIGTLLFWPNVWPLLLGPPTLAWLLGYSLAKRFTPLCHYWLGVALGLSPLATHIAITGHVADLSLWAPAWLGLGIAAWVGGFDILYACQDEAFDRASGLRSIPADLGRRRAFWVARVSHALAALAFALFGVAAGFGFVYFAGLVLIAGLLAYEHAIVSPNDLSRVGVAFFTLNAVVSFGLLMLGAIDLALRA